MDPHVELVLGSIVEEETDIIVNSANTDLVMAGGVAAAILHEAGAEVEEEAVQHAPVAVGDVVVTSAGNLHARHILHVAVVGSAQPDLYECTRNVLNAAEELEAGSVALPALGTGSAGLAPPEAAHDLCSAIKDHFDETGSRLRIRIVIWDEEIYPVFQRALKRAFAEKPSSEHD